jgi:glutamate carboxypeptidase
MLRCLRRAVEIESPTHSKPDVDRMASFFAQECRRNGGKVRLLAHQTAGSAVLAEFFSQELKRSQKPIMLLGHIDTVWERGPLARLPFRVSGGRAYGPGILDMKSGIVCGLYAIRALRALHLPPHSPIQLFLNSDEEVSTLAFRNEIIAQAKKARAVLVLEPAAAGGALKTARKGVGEFQITVHGRSAHAGIDPEAGINAVSELARQLLRLERIARLRPGLTLNVGVIEGGTRTNVIPERASARIDVRILRLRDREVVERKVHGLKPFRKGARLEIKGGVNRPPMERVHAVALYGRARELGRELAMDLQEASTGGGSDGNFTAALGIPTLDGLGGVGDGAHGLREHVVIRELPRRAALLAALLATL